VKIQVTTSIHEQLDKYGEGSWKRSAAFLVSDRQGLDARRGLLS